MGTRAAGCPGPDRGGRVRDPRGPQGLPPTAVAHLAITVAGQDDFRSGRLELYPDAVLGALRRQASRYRRERPSCHDTAENARETAHLGDSND